MFFWKRNLQKKKEELQLRLDHLVSFLFKHVLAFQEVDYRASCACHHELVSSGWVCSVCLSVLCQFMPICKACGYVLCFYEVLIIIVICMFCNASSLQCDFQSEHTAPESPETKAERIERVIHLWLLLGITSVINTLLTVPPFFDMRSSFAMYFHVHFSSVHFPSLIGAKHFCR